MPLPSKITDDLIVRGRVTPTTLDIPEKSITDKEISASAAIATAKLKHRFHADYSQPNTAATTETRTLFVSRVVTEVSGLVAGSVAPNTGNATVTIDLKRNGVSVLTGVLTLDSTNLARVTKDGTVNNAMKALAVGDWLETVITAAAGTGTLATGVFLNVVLSPSTNEGTESLNFSVAANSQYIPLL